MTGNGSRDGRDEGPASSAEGDLSRRLARLGSELEARRKPVEPPRSEPMTSSSEPSALGRAFRASTEFVAGVIAGGGLGWLIDKVAGTSPWGLIVFLLLGFAAGIYNVMRASGFLAPARGSGSPDR
ncbi:MAG: AtpZ/AtpI family protein [Methylobacteriaceae bacterium]|nr:AtpZ/AtpI family protein [Methylobacteriaceae bacterium]